MKHTRIISILLSGIALVSLTGCNSQTIKTNFTAIQSSMIYSLGNYWFNEKTLDTMLLQLHFSGNDDNTQLTVQVIPAVQSGYQTIDASEFAEQSRIYDFLESISVNVEISDEGIVTPLGATVNEGGIS